MTEIDLSYYPGCTLKTTAKNFEDCAVASMKVLDINLKELPRWNCCGTVYSLAEDDLLRHLAPIRNLIRVKEEGDSKVVTLCSFCYNTLKRANLLMKDNAANRDALNDFMDEELDYNGDVQVLHLLEVLRDEIGWENISRKVKKSLQGLRISPYYGCTLLRPREVAIDEMEKPVILHDFLESLGAFVVDSPLAMKCCGSFQIVSGQDHVLECAWNILDAALRQEADALVLSCPLCNYNLSKTQEELKRKYSNFQGIPIFYFTQLLALSLGIDPQVCGFELNYVDPRPLLQSKNLLD